MNFHNLKMKNIELSLRFTPTLKSWVAKGRADHIIGIALEGSAFHDFGYQKFDIEKDCIFFLNQRDDFSCSVKEISPCFSIHFTTYEEIETDSFCIKVKNSTPVIKLFEKQIKIPIANTHSAQSNFYRICELFTSIYRNNHSKEDSRIDVARAFIDSYFTSHDCLSQMYAGCELSRRRLDELFKESELVTPARYITEKRIEHAKKLLLLPNMSIQEISEMCGFSDVYYFSKVFKAETGETPGGFRKILK